jgi:hypothetical protein
MTDDRDCGCGLGETCPGWPTGGREPEPYELDYDDD